MHVLLVTSRPFVDEVQHHQAFGLSRPPVLSSVSNHVKHNSPWHLTWWGFRFSNLSAWQHSVFDPSRMSTLHSHVNSHSFGRVVTRHYTEVRLLCHLTFPLQIIMIVIVSSLFCTPLPHPDANDRCHPKLYQTTKVPYSPYTDKTRYLLIFTMLLHELTLGGYSRHPQPSQPPVSMGILSAATIGWCSGRYPLAPIPRAGLALAGT